MGIVEERYNATIHTTNPIEKTPINPQTKKRSRRGKA
jgi:hypothetical protein